MTQKISNEVKATRTLIYNKFPINRFMVFKYEEFTFRFDTKLDPIPVEVPSDIADILLEMVDTGCRCHYTKEKPKKLFLEVE